MSTEEKARAYDEALERAKKLSVDGYLDAIAVEEIFPQLRESESEDERIRKEMIAYFAHRADVTEFIDEGEDCKRWISYLEKQKEQEHVCDSAQFEEGFKTGLEIGLRKQKEQKEELVYRLNELMQDYIKEGKDDEEKEHRLKCYQLFWDALEDTNFFEQKEQKPAEWSKQQVVNALTSMLNERITPFHQKSLDGTIGDKEKMFMDAFVEMRSFVNSPSFDIGKENSAEWSEEDEDMLNSCISSIEEAKENRYAYKETDGDTSYDHEIAWLKSIRPSWKPSEVQLNALNFAITYFMHETNYKNPTELRDLYDDLLKLKQP